jgi:tight adherence protein C
MVIFIISAGICVFCLVLLVFGSASRENEAILKRLKRMTQATTRKVYSDEELYQPLTQRFLIPLLQIILTHVSAILPKSSNDKLAQQLLLSGSTINPREYQAMRFLVVLGTTLFFAGAGFLIQKDISVVFLFGIMGAIIGTLIMRFKLLGEIKKRISEMKDQIPEVLDLLSVSVEAGLSFDGALIHVSNRFKGALIDEFVQVQHEIQMGRPRREALKNMANRCNTDELKSFSSAVIQAEQLGISLKNVLKAQAAYIRQQRRQAVEEKAMKAPVKIMIPLALFIFPVLFIILLGPAVINIIEMLGDM